MSITAIKDYGKMRNGGRVNKYAIFVASTQNYLGYTNALLNSFEKRRLFDGYDLTVYLMYFSAADKGTFSPAYLKDLTKFSYKIIPIEMNRNDVGCPENFNTVEFVKRARFHYIMKYGFDYDVICLLDADMYMVSPDFIQLFDLVDGTNKCIACNERYKWAIGENFIFENKPIFEKPVKMYAMHCSIPIILNLNQWESVFEYYLKISFHGKQIKNGLHCGIGDIFSWNISVYKNNKQRDIVVFPMETMCQVHHTTHRPGTYPVVENDYWYTWAGDRVYSIQGRVANSKYVDASLAIMANEFKIQGRTDYEKIAAQVKPGLIAILKEWYNLNFSCKLILSDYTAYNHEWDEIKRKVDLWH